MKHLQFVNYPQYLYFVCHESRVGVFPYASLEQQNTSKLLGVFYREMEQHGYDVLTPADEVSFKKAMLDMNNAIRKDARRYGDSSYEKLTIKEEICRCGKWLFLRNSPSLSERTTVPIVYKNTRQKPSVQSKQKTVPIRVPADKKEKIKKLVDWLVEIQEENLDITGALWSALWNLKRTAENMNYNPEIADKMMKEVDLLEQLYIKLMWK